jgi:hypothetical protein
MRMWVVEGSSERAFNGRLDFFYIRLIFLVKDKERWVSNYVAVSRLVSSDNSPRFSRLHRITTVILVGCFVVPARRKMTAV